MNNRFMNNNGSKGFFKKLGILVLVAFAVISCSLTGMVGGFVPITTVKAADYDVKLGDNAYGTFFNGTLYIEGNGKLYDGKRIKATPRDSTENLLNVNYVRELHEIEIQEGITEIGQCALSDLTVLKIVKLPRSLKAIDYCAFMGSFQPLNPNDEPHIDRKIYFTGDCPKMDDSIFTYVDGLNLYYPENNSTWTKDKLKDYSGTNIKWIPYAVQGADPSPTPTQDPTSSPSSAPNKDESIYKAVQDISWPLLNEGLSFTNADGSKRKEGQKLVDIWDSAYWGEVTKKNNAVVKQILNDPENQKRTWKGDCYGLSLIACLNQMGVINVKALTGKTGNNLNEYGYSDIASASFLDELSGFDGKYTHADKTLTELIDKGQLSQYFNTMDNATILVDDVMPSDIVETIESLCSTRSIMVGMNQFDSEGKSLGGHEVVIPKGSKHYNSTVQTNGKTINVSYFILYDPNYPQLSSSLKNNIKGLSSDLQNGASILGFDPTNQIAVYITGDLNQKNTMTLDWSEKHREKTINGQREIDFLDPAKCDSSFYKDRLSLFSGDNSKIFMTGKDIAIKNENGTIYNKINGVSTYLNNSASLKYEMNDGSASDDDSVLSWLVAPEGENTIVLGSDGGTVSQFSNNDSADSSVTASGAVNYTVDEENNVSLVANEDNVNVTITTTTNNGTESQTTTGVLNKGEYLNLKEDPNTHKVYGETNSTSNTKPSGDVKDGEGNKKDNVIFGKTEPSAKPESGKTVSNGTDNTKSNNKANLTQQNKKSDKKESPKTGDTGNVELYIGLLAAAVVAGMVVMFIRRKHA